MQNACAPNIIITGGCSAMDGLPDRIKTEVESMFRYVDMWIGEYGNRPRLCCMLYVVCCMFGAMDVCMFCCCHVSLLLVHQEALVFFHHPIISTSLYNTTILIIIHLPTSLRLYIYRTTLPHFSVKAIAAPAIERSICPWLGGSILGSLGAFRDIYMSKAEWKEHGAALLDKKCP